MERSDNSGNKIWERKQSKGLGKKSKGADRR